MQTYTINVHVEPQPGTIEAVMQKIKAYQHEHGLDADAVRTPLGIFIRDAAGEIIGGLHGGYSGDWLFIDTVWLHESLRGQGYGTRLMQTIEQHVARAGIQQVALGTNSFQAPGFYMKLGYEALVMLENMIGNHDNYIMAKHSIPLLPDFTAELPVAAPPSREDVKALNRYLNAYNESKVGRFRPQPLLVTLNGANGEIVGAALAGTVESFCQLDCFWLDAALTGQKDAVRLLDTLHTQLAERGIKRIVGIFTGAAEYQGLASVGYGILSCLENYPAGHTTYFLMNDALGATRQ